MQIARNMRRVLIGAILASVALPGVVGAMEQASKQGAASPGSFDSNPFSEPSELQFHAPAFDRIRPADYLPAFEEGTRRQLLEVAAIADNQEPPTFENTIVAMERSGQLLARVTKVFSNINEAATNDQMERVGRQIDEELTRHLGLINSNPRLFARIAKLYARRATLALDPESDRLLSAYYDRFVRAGAMLGEADKAKLADIDQRLAALIAEAIGNVRNATGAGVIVDDKADLDGLPDAQINAASARASARHLQGKWLLPLENDTRQWTLQWLTHRALRERVYRASIGRNDADGPNDNRAIVSEIAQLRAQRARLLGYPDFASFTLASQMARDPKTVIDMLERIGAPAVTKATAEAAKLQQLIDQQADASHTPRFKLQPWDWDYYAEQERSAEHGFDKSRISPYFELDRVLDDGVFFSAHVLYGLTFKERKDLPVYEPDVRVFEVLDEHGKSLALIYLDYFARDNKQGGAWMDTYVDPSSLLGTRPVIVNVCSFRRPAPGQPALLSFDDVTSMFDLFGYALSAILSDVKYPTLSGTSTALDYVSLASQFNENWALDPSVLARYARHYQTGEAMPAEMVAEIEKPDTFNKGYETTEYVESALIDMAWHTLPPDAQRQDADALEAAVLKKHGVAVDVVPPRYRSAYFEHIWGYNYAAGYYAYLWTAVLSQDAFAWFNAHGGMTRANGQHFQDTILSRGGTKAPHFLYLDFRGSEPSVVPYLKNKGLDSAASQ